MVLNKDLVNIDNSHNGSNLFSNTKIPMGIHTLPPASNNIESAKGVYVYSHSQKGGKINRNKINKISRKYKMRGSKKTIKRRIKRIKSKIRSKYNRTRTRRRYMKGGSFQSPMGTPNYSPGHSQYLNNYVGDLNSNTYSLGGKLNADNSALANPPPVNVVKGEVDNLNHNTLNSYGNIGAGSGFPSRGWF